MAKFQKNTSNTIKTKNQINKGKTLLLEILNIFQTANRKLALGKHGTS